MIYDTIAAAPLRILFTTGVKCHRFGPNLHLFVSPRNYEMSRRSFRQQKFASLMGVTLLDCSSVAAVACAVDVTVAYAPVAAPWPPAIATAAPVAVDAVATVTDAQSFLSVVLAGRR